MQTSIPAFICDSMLGRLAKKLRMLGLDALYARDFGPDVLNDMAWRGRILLTRRSAALKEKHGRLSACIFIHHDNPDRQVQEVLAACSIDAADTAPFSRCLRCNAPLEAITQQEARGRVPEYVHASVGSFSACPRCRRVYWRGTHRESMLSDVRNYWQ